MRHYRLSPATQSDLSSIWDYTVERSDANQAETYELEIRCAIERIAEQPDRGHSVDEIRDGYRCYPSGSLIFYVESDDGVDVIRILHQRMDPTRHL